MSTVSDLKRSKRELIAENMFLRQQLIVLERQVVRPNTAAWILTTTLKFTACQSPEEAVAFAGLAPHARQSGSSLNTNRSIGNGGHERLRQALYLAALPAVRFNPTLCVFYQRLLSRGKPKKVALMLRPVNCFISPGLL